MRQTLIVSALFAASTTVVSAGGFDRSNQAIGVLFEDDNYVELTLAYVAPNLTGTDLASSGSTGNAADRFGNFALGLKFQVFSGLSLALVIDEPFGSDVIYPTTPASVLLGGTEAIVDTIAVTGLARYKFGGNYSVHGGVRYQSLEADVTLGGMAFGGLNGYNAQFDSDDGIGYSIGAAYERPEIALRLAVTYNSEITHELPTQETIGGMPVAPPGTTEVDTPQSLNIDLRTGIAENTLFIGSIRYANYSNVTVAPDFFDAAVDMIPGNGTSLANIENSIDYTLGIGYRFSPTWSASFSLGFGTEDGDELVSPLAPTDGFTFLSVGARYAQNNVVVSGGLRLTDFGDAFAETGTPDEARAAFTGNEAISAALRLGYRF